MARIVPTRRQALRLAAGAAAAPLLPRVARGDAPVRVGLILTMSGPSAGDGDVMAKAAGLFLRARGAELLGGERIELIIRDDGGADPQAARELVRELVVREGVHYLGGIQWTSSADALAPLLDTAKIPCVLMGACGSRTTRLSPYFVRTSFTLWQSSYHLGRWAAGQGIGSAYVLVVDLPPGQEAQAAFTHGFREAGGRIAAAVRMPVPGPGFLPFLRRVREARPEALFAVHAGGAQTLPFMRAVAEAGLLAEGIRLIGPGVLTGEEALPGMGAAAQGVITAHHYSPAADRPANAAFLAAWRGAYGATGVRPNDMAVGVWDGMHAICTAAAATGGGRDVAAAMRTLTAFHCEDSPRGPIRIDAATRDIVQNIYIREVRMADGAPANVEIATIPAVKDPWKELNPA